ncbi:MAG: PLDc_N domain-containing protein [Alphaproteobacteria bacterium]|nr:PLDc_N domain-containing protein [Alphaproteobacteria bacterium]
MSGDPLTDSQLLLLALPLVALDVLLRVVALVQLYRAERVRWDSKPLWAALILLVSTFGWLAWFIVGRPSDPA